MMLHENTDKKRQEFFNERADNWLDMWYKNEETGDYSKYDQQFERLFRLVDLKRGDSILDLGCGSGVLIPYILERIGSGGHVHEVDYAEKMIAVNKRLHKDPRITFQVANASDLNAPEMAFDTALCFSCFPHFENKPKTLETISRSLKPRGRLVIAHFDSSSDINALHRKHNSVMHDYLPDEKQMQILLTKAGFTVEQFIDASGFYYLGARKG